MAIDADAQRRVMGYLATGVTVVTSRVGDELCGMTANAVTSLSLDPPLVLVAVDKRAAFHACLKAGGGFAVNVLSVEQEDLSRRFATSGLKDFSDLDWTEAASGAAVFSDALAWVDCRLVEVLPGGDHDIFIGEILAGDAREGSPLLFYRGKYRRLDD
ncbi:MAG: flavin reductase family protein [Pirellulales bacterium]